MKENDVLRFFIDPANPDMQFEKFAKGMIESAVGEGTSPEQQLIRQQMGDLVKEVANARQFNETYLGHMLSESSIPGMMGHILATRLGGNTVAEEVSRMETKLEPEAIRFLLDIVGYDKNEASGTFTSGGSMAVFTALTVARKIVQQVNEEQGINSPARLFVYTTPMAHYCLDKALDYLGGQNRGISKVLIGTTNFKMNPIDLKEKILSTQKDGTPMAIYAIAGETETGLVDPLDEIVDVADQMRKNDINLFTIADAAFGAPYRISQAGSLFDSLPKFDAVVVDGHKAFYTPYPNGAVVFKNAGQHALFGMGVRSAYLGPEEAKTAKEEHEELTSAFLYKNSDYMLRRKRPEGSAGAGSILSTVATKRTFGMEGLATVLNRTLERTRFLYERLTVSEYLRPVHNPDVNVLCFNLTKTTEEALGFPKNGTEKNKWRGRVLESVRRHLNLNDSGRSIENTTGYYFSSTDLPTDVIDEGKTKETGEEFRVKEYALRAVLMNPRTTEAILEAAVTKMENRLKRMIRAKEMIDRIPRNN